MTLAVLAACAAPRGGGDVVLASEGRTLEVRGGRWLDAGGFTPRTVYVVGGRLSGRRPARVDSVIDATGLWVVPPRGEAHNHNVEWSTPARTDSLVARYRRDGVFYVMNPGSLPRGLDSLRLRVNVPAGVDAVFSYGLLTATGGHPTGLWRRNVARGGMTEADGDGGFLWIIDSLPDLDRKWPRILAGHPDFIKTVLVHSEEFARRRTDTAFFNWRGLDPALLPEVVRRAHAARLRVSAHVETAADFRAAINAGVDVIAHMPGFRGDERGQFPDPAMFELTPDDARRAAASGTIVTTTLGGLATLDANGPDSLRRRAADRLHRRNLALLRDAGARLAVGSDDYRDDSSAEVAYLATLGTWTPLELLRLWSEATPRAIFPARRVGCLDEGCEASFLALDRDPSLDVAALRAIRLRVKDGRVLAPR